MRNGEGTFYWGDGSLFRGHWKDDEKEGDGEYYLPDGAIVTGNWKEDEIDGIVKTRFTNGDELFQFWEKGKLIRQI